MLVEFGIACDGIATQQVNIKGLQFSAGCQNVRAFPKTEVPPGHLQIQCLGFSLNYRDLAILEELISKHNPNMHPIGSEYVGLIISTHENETKFHPGQYVLFSYSYHGFHWSQHQTQGLLSSHCSSRFSLVKCAITKIVPPGMTLAQAAAFSISSQTAYAMVRRSRLQAGDRALVYSTSATSLAVIRRLLEIGVSVSVITSRPAHWQSRIKGVEHWFDANNQLISEIEGHCLTLGGFAAIFDPFFDRNCLDAISFLQPFGRYITCGIAAQSSITDLQTSDFSVYELFILGLLNNIEMIFSCLGTDADLEHALADFIAGRFAVEIDSVFSISQEAEFLQRSFSKDKSGKVVFLYPEANPQP